MGNECRAPHLFVLSEIEAPPMRWSASAGFWRPSRDS